MQPRRKMFLPFSLWETGARKLAIPYIGNIHIEVCAERECSFFLREQSPVNMISIHQPRVPQRINLFFIIKKVCIRTDTFMLYYTIVFAKEREKWQNWLN